MEKDDNVRMPYGMVNNNYWSMTCNFMEGVEGRGLQKGVKAWQGLYLYNKLLAIIQQLPMPHHKITKWIRPLNITVSTINNVLW